MITNPALDAFIELNPDLDPRQVRTDYRAWCAVTGYPAGPASFTDFIFYEGLRLYGPNR